MKITIEKGMNVQNALDKIKDFLEEQFSEYPNLQSNLNVYLSLKNSSGDICPQNGREYEIYSDRVDDVIELAKNEAYYDITERLKAFLRSELHKKECILHDIEVANNYIVTAGEKGRKPQNIEKRKNDLLKYQAKLELVEQGVKLYSLLNALHQQKKTKVLFIRQDSGRSYNSDIQIDCILLFLDNGEIEGYFDYYEGFKKEVPEDYRRIFS